MYTGFISNGAEDDFRFSIDSSTNGQIDLFTTSLKQELQRAPTVSQISRASAISSRGSQTRSLKLLSPAEPFTLRFRSQTEEAQFREHHSKKFFFQGMFITSFMVVGVPLMAIFNDIEGGGKADLVDIANFYVLICTMVLIVSVVGMWAKPAWMQNWMTLTALNVSFAIIIYNRFRGEFSDVDLFGQDGKACRTDMALLPRSCRENLVFENTVNTFTGITTFLSANMFLLQAGYKLLFLQSITVIVLTVFLCLWLLPWHLLLHDGIAFLRVALVEILMLITSLFILRSCEQNDRLEYILWKAMHDRHEEQVNNIVHLYNPPRYRRRCAIYDPPFSYWCSASATGGGGVFMHHPSCIALHASPFMHPHVHAPSRLTTLPRLRRRGRSSRPRSRSSTA
jgi:hypothetical protein